MFDRLQCFGPFDEEKVSPLPYMFIVYSFALSYKCCVPFCWARPDKLTVSIESANATIRLYTGTATTASCLICTVGVAIFKLRTGLTVTDVTFSSYEIKFSNSFSLLIVRESNERHQVNNCWLI